MLTGSIYGISIGCLDIRVQWAERLQRLGVGENGITVEVHLGKKQQTETVEASNLVEEFC